MILSAFYLGLWGNGGEWPLNLQREITGLIGGNQRLHHDEQAWPFLADAPDDATPCGGFR